MSDPTKGDPGFTLSDAPASDAAPGALPRIDFATFVLSLAASAMMHLGLVAGPEGQKRERPDLAMAQQTIDTLEMLLEKTRGNLDADEARLLESVLYEVRMSFVRAERTA
jgi:hypothetical protein